MLAIFLKNIALLITEYYCSNYLKTKNASKESVRKKGLSKKTVSQITIFHLAL